MKHNKPTSRVPHATRKPVGSTFAERLAARKALWPQSAREYTPCSDEMSKLLSKQPPLRTTGYEQLVAMGMPVTALNVDIKRLRTFTVALAQFHASLGEYADERNAEDFAQHLIQHHGFPRWLCSAERPGHFVSGKAVLIPRLLSDRPLEEVLGEVYGLLGARTPTAEEYALLAEVQDV